MASAEARPQSAMSRRAPPSAKKIAVVQAAATGTSDIGCISIMRTAGLVATSQAAITPARGEPSRQADAVSHPRQQTAERGDDPEHQLMSADDLAQGHDHREPRRIHRYKRPRTIQQNGPVAERRERPFRARPRCCPDQRFRNQEIPPDPEVGLADISVSVGRDAHGCRIHDAQKGRPGGDPNRQSAVADRSNARDNRCWMSVNAGDPRVCGERQRRQRRAALTGSLLVMVRPAILRLIPPPTISQRAQIPLVPARTRSRRAVTTPMVHA